MVISSLDFVRLIFFELRSGSDSALRSPLSSFAIRAAAWWMNDRAINAVEMTVCPSRDLVQVEFFALCQRFFTRDN